MLGDLRNSMQFYVMLGECSYINICIYIYIYIIVYVIAILYSPIIEHPTQYKLWLGPEVSSMFSTLASARRP